MLGVREIPTSDIPSPDEPGWSEWQTWFARMGLDPHQMPRNGEPIVCDDDARNITFSRWRRNADGKLMVERNRVVTDRVSVQLEAHAPQFPDARSRRH